MKKQTTALMTDASKLTADSSRLLGSRKGHDREGFDDMISALESITEIVKIAREIEYDL